MNQMLEAWKQIPDVSDEVTPPPKSQTSSKGNLILQFWILVLIGESVIG